MKTSCGVKEHQIYIVLGCMLYSRLRNIQWLVVVSHGKHGNSNLLTIHLQLLDSRRSVYITCHKKWLLAFVLELICKLCRRGGLTCSLKSTHHDDRDLIGWSKLDLCHLRAHELIHLFLNDLDDHVSRIQTFEDFLSYSSVTHRLDK